MATAGFKRAMPHLLVHEGGKVDHPRDPGGRTNQGVTQRVYNGYRTRRGQPTRDVFQLTPRERDIIYREQYWNVINGDKLPAGIDYVLFDGAVNSGPVQSIKWCQRALAQAGVYSGKVDGHMGESTMAALDLHPNHDKLIEAICDRRMTFLRELKTWADFKNGWTRRVRDVLRVGQLYASGETKVPLPEFQPGVNERAEITDAKKPPSTAPGDMAAAGGAPVGGGVAETVNKTQDALAPAVGVSDWVDTIYAVLVVTGVAVTIGGILYGLWVRKRRAEMNDALDSQTPAALGVAA